MLSPARYGIALLTILLVSCGGGGGGGSSSNPPPAGPGSPPLAASRVFVAGGITSSVAEIASYTSATFTTGALTPDRVISGSNTLLNAPANGGPRGIAVDVADDRLFAVNIDTNSILVFDGASQANGNIAPSRTIVGGLTQLDSPIFLYLDTLNDKLYVTNGGSSQSILVFNGASTATGNIPPSSAISGFEISFGRLLGVEVDVGRDILYATDTAARIYVFDGVSTLTGNTVTTATRTITGGATTLSFPVGMARGGDSLYVADSGNILVFDGASAATGNIAPSRTFTSSVVGFDPRVLFLDTTHNRLYVSNSSQVKLDYFDGASAASGSTAPTASASLTGMQAPFGIFVDTR